VTPANPPKNALDGEAQPDQTSGKISAETELWTMLRQRPERMSLEKTSEKLLRGESDANIRFGHLCHLLQAKGFRMRTQGSHHIFTRLGVRERINLQREGSHAKPYLVRQVRRILASYKLL
jgi:predicted RNA binding protein YcfA (HicA-like mRNA interferase family)